jgi:hypothetical protein
MSICKNGQLYRLLRDMAESGFRKDLRRTECRLEVAFVVRSSLSYKREATPGGTQLDQLAVIFRGPESIALRWRSTFQGRSRIRNYKQAH